MHDVPRRWNAQTAAIVAKEAELALDSTDPSPAAMRWRYEQERAYWNEGGPTVEARDESVPTRFGTVRVRVYRDGDHPAPGIVYIHGGGYVVGSPETHDRLTRTLARATGAVVVSVDYTLAPEGRFPQPIEECVAVVQAVRERADEWGIVADDLTLAGDSCGATLALATWLWLRDELAAADGIGALLLFYGAFGLRDSASRRTLGGPWDGMTPEDMASWQAEYMDPADVGSSYDDLLARDLDGVPPCHVVATDLDPLLDDSRALAALLGEGHELVVVEGVLHTFLQYGRMLDEAEAGLARAAEFFRTRRLRPGRDG